MERWGVYGKEVEQDSGIRHGMDIDSFISGILFSERNSIRLFLRCRDDNSQSLVIHAYVGAPAGNSSAQVFEVPATQFRPDVNETCGIRGNHGFESTIWTSKTGTQDVYLYAINIGSGDNTFLGSWKVTIDYDKEAPKISNVKISNVTATGYTVSCTATDNEGVTKVQFPTWTENGGQDDLIWHNAVKSGNTYTYTVKNSEHIYRIYTIYKNKAVIIADWEEELLDVDNVYLDKNNNLVFDFNGTILEFYSSYKIKKGKLKFVKRYECTNTRGDDWDDFGYYIYYNENKIKTISEQKFYRYYKSCTLLSGQSNTKYAKIQDGYYESVLTMYYDEDNTNLPQTVKAELSGKTLSVTGTIKIYDSKYSLKDTLNIKRTRTFPLAKKVKYNLRGLETSGEPSYTTKKYFKKYLK